jgi:hypothetical protein
MGLPDRWLGSNNLGFISLDSKGKIKCRRLHDIYKALLEPVAPTEDGKHKRLELIEGIHKLVRVLLLNKYLRVKKFNPF